MIGFNTDDNELEEGDLVDKLKEMSQQTNDVFDDTILEKSKKNMKTEWILIKNQKQQI